MTQKTKDLCIAAIEQNIKKCREQLDAAKNTMSEFDFNCYHHVHNAALREWSQALNEVKSLETYNNKSCKFEEEKSMNVDEIVVKGAALLMLEIEYQSILLPSNDVEGIAKKLEEMKTIANFIEKFKAGKVKVVVEE